MRHIPRPTIAKMTVKFKVMLKMIICILQYEEFASRSRGQLLNGSMLEEVMGLKNMTVLDLSGN